MARYVCSSDPAPRALGAVALVLWALTGCVEVGLREARRPFDYSALPSPPPPAPRPGAIWPGDSPSGSFLFFDRKARGVGDLVRVLIEDDVSAEGEASTGAHSKSTLSADLTSDIGLDRLVAAPVKAVLRWLGISNPGRTVPAGSTLTALDANTDNKFDGDGKTTRRGRFRAVLTCRVVEVLPGHVFHIRGRRATVVNHEVQYLTLEGLVRQEDIGIDNTVSSTALAEAKLTLDGLGVIDDRQRPGFVARVLSWIYPF